MSATKTIEAIEACSTLAGMSDRELAKAAGMTTSTLHRRFRERSGLKVDELFALADALDVPPMVLTEGPEYASRWFGDHRGFAGLYGGGDHRKYNATPHPPIAA